MTAGSAAIGVVRRGAEGYAAAPEGMSQRNEPIESLKQIQKLSNPLKEPVAQPVEQLTFNQ